MRRSSRARARSAALGSVRGVDIGGSYGDAGVQCL
jgi:hypothetical protein